MGVVFDSKVGSPGPALPSSWVDHQVELALKYLHATAGRARGFAMYLVEPLRQM